jgi:hypothetical protein
MSRLNAQNEERKLSIYNKGANRLLELRKRRKLLIARERILTGKCNSSFCYASEEDVIKKYPSLREDRQIWEHLCVNQPSRFDRTLCNFAPNYILADRELMMNACINTAICRGTQLKIFDNIDLSLQADRNFVSELLEKAPEILPTINTATQLRFPDLTKQTFRPYALKESGSAANKLEYEMSGSQPNESPRRGIGLA